MAKHPSPSASSPARKSPRPQPESAAAAEAENLPASASSSPPPAGFIFMCSGATKPECFRYRVLGLPRGRLDAVARIRRGAGLFLYDFDAKYLYGPYRADTDGGLALEPTAFQGRYPAQVKFSIDGDFMPIPESSVRNAIKENYSRGKFWPELTFAQVEKLRALFRPITSVPESTPGYYVDDRHAAPPASHPTQPAAHVHHPTAYVPPPASHLVPHEPYAHPYAHLAPPMAQFTIPVYYATTTGHPYQAGYESNGPLPSTYQYAQEPPSHYLYAQHPMPDQFPAPVYSTDAYYAAHQNDPYRLDTSKPHYLESTSERTAYGAAHEVVATNLQLVRHYGSTPSSETAEPEAAATNLGLVRSYGSVPSSATERTTQSNADGATSATYFYAGAPATTQGENIAVPSVYFVATAPAFL